MNINNVPTFHFHGIFSLVRETNDERISNRRHNCRRKYKRPGCRWKLKGGACGRHEDHHLDFQMAALLPSDVHHPICTKATLPGGYSQSLTELGRDTMVWELFEFSTIQLGSKDSLRPYQLFLPTAPSVAFTQPSFFPSLGSLQSQSRISAIAPQPLLKTPPHCLSKHFS